ncbi:hypothetical protein [Pseudonocardia parietis]|uniref:Collagen type III alpha n=1 Tax=Pseudonocardia parietis TaxID=570936 RepID=A0ABS4W2K1_9PSEU|nr:hypothetical protein [Pseudonocardia parietis]MBP2370178.1 collagen type III alpha [Pseudonocardia parietis]
MPAGFGAPGTTGTTPTGTAAAGSRPASTEHPPTPNRATGSGATGIDGGGSSRSDLAGALGSSSTGSGPTGSSPGSSSSGSGPTGSSLGGSSTGSGFADLVRDSGTARPRPTGSGPGAPTAPSSGDHPRTPARATPAAGPDGSTEDVPDATGFGLGDDSYADLGDLGDDPLGVGPLPADDSDDPLHTPEDRFAPPPSFAPEPSGESTATPATGRQRMGGRVGTDGVPVTEPAPTVVPPISPPPRPIDETTDDTTDASRPAATTGGSDVPAASDVTSTAARDGREAESAGDPAASKQWPPRPSRSTSDGPETVILPPRAFLGHYPAASAESTSRPADPEPRPDTPASGTRPPMPGRRRPAPAGPEHAPPPRPAMGGSATAGLSGNDLFAAPSGPGAGRGFGELPGRGADTWSPARRDDPTGADDADPEGTPAPGTPAPGTAAVRTGSAPAEPHGSPAIGPRADRGLAPRSAEDRAGSSAAATAGAERSPASSDGDRAGHSGAVPRPAGDPSDRSGEATTVFAAHGGSPGAGTGSHPVPAARPPGSTGAFRSTGAPADGSSWGPPGDRGPAGAPRGPGAPGDRSQQPPASAGRTPTAGETTVTLSAVGTDGRPRPGGTAPSGRNTGEGTTPVAPDRAAGDPGTRNAAAAASVGAVSVAAARSASGRDGGTDGTGPGTTGEPGAGDGAAAKPIHPRREAIMSAKPRNGRRGVSPAGLAIALAILLLGTLTLWAMFSPTPQNDGAPANGPAAAGEAGPGFGARPAAAQAGASLPQPTVRATVPAGDSPVAVAASTGGAVLVAVRDANRLLVVDGATDAVTSEIPLPAAPQGVTTSPDGTRAFVSMSDGTGGQVAVVDVPGGTLVSTVPVTADPAGAVSSADGRFLYLPSRAEGVVDELDPYAGVVTRSVPVSRDPYAAATNEAADRVYLATRGADQLTVLDPNTLTVLGSFPVAGGAETVAVTPVAVPETLVAVAGPDSGTITVLNPADGREVATVEAAGGPTGLAFAADGRHLYVTTDQGLQTVDTGSWEVTGTTDVAPDPTAVTVSPDGRTGWVAGDGEVSVLNLT